MRVFSRGDEVRSFVHDTRRQGRRSGLVPTMGALHAGHLSLTVASVEQCDCTVATIFVNPTQFGPEEDLDRYPRTLEADLDALRQSGVDACFVPEVEEMYPPGCTTAVEPPEVARRWEGEFRPGHFHGVATIVLKLFQLIPADDAFFGQKDYQQALVIRQMAADLKVPMRIHTCPTVREQDGLALSSRNRYLSEQQRQTALAVPRSLRRAAELVGRGERDVAGICEAMRETLQQGGVTEIDYAALADADTLEPPRDWQRPVVALIAAHVGDTRLIDNQIIEA